MVDPVGRSEATEIARQPDCTIVTPTPRMIRTQSMSLPFDGEPDDEAESLTAVSSPTASQKTW